MCSACRRGGGLSPPRPFVIKCQKVLIVFLLVFYNWTIQGKELDVHGRGKEIYQKYCSVCHGTKGEAETPLGQVLQPPPRDLADPVAMARINDAGIREAIQEGKPGTSMPAWKSLLNTQEIDDVSAYVKNLRRPRPAGMTQDEFDTRVGGEIYRSYCGICHGNAGNAQTTIGHVLIDKPQDFTDPLSMAKLSNEEMARAIAYGRPGTAMVAWQTILSPEDIRRVVLFIRRRFVPAK